MNPIIFAGQTITPLELAAFITGLISVWLTMRMHVANWPVGMVNVICFAVLFVEAKLYADALLQVVFFALGAYGWWTWSSVKASPASLPVARARVQEIGVLGVLAFVLTPAAAMTLMTWTDSPAPWADASVLVLSLLATWLQARRQIESWVLWIVVDLISIPLYWSRALPLTSGLYVIFLVICIFGFIGWKARLVRTEAFA